MATQRHWLPGQLFPHREVRGPGLPHILILPSRGAQCRVGRQVLRDNPGLAPTRLPRPRASGPPTEAKAALARGPHTVWPPLGPCASQPPKPAGAAPTTQGSTNCWTPVNGPDPRHVPSSLPPLRPVSGSQESHAMPCRGPSVHLLLSLCASSDLSPGRTGTRGGLIVMPARKVSCF